MQPYGASDRIVLYSDLNCPFCYAMHERLHDSGVMDRIAWRGVEHAPHLPVPMATWNGRLLEELRQEVTTVGRLAPMLPIAVPTGKPNTNPAIRLAARLMAINSELGTKVVRRLYQLFWREGHDISDPTTLRSAMVELGIDDDGLLEKNGEEVRILECWDEEWRKTGHSGVPLLVRADGTLLMGLAQEKDLNRFLAGA